MSAPPLKKGQLNCSAKIRYSDESSARASVSLYCEQYNVEKMYIYSCPHCKRWHGTKNFNRYSIAVTAKDTFAEKTS